MGNLEQEEMEKVQKKKKKSHRLYAFVVLVLGVAIIALGIVLLFYVQKIEISGNEYCSDQEIVDSVQNDQYSINALYIVGKYALGKGEVLPCFESMKVGLKAPWIVNVKVEEKPIVGYVRNGDNYDYFDKEGLVVLESSALIEGLPRIDGIEVKDIKLYQQLKSDDTRIFEEILETSKEVTKYELPTDKIVCKDDNIYLYIGKVCVNLGKSVSSEQIAQIKPILEKLGDQEGTLHLENYSEVSGTITFDIGEIPQEN
ncbi:cell division protein FtsQ/DivIB [Bariatricus sp. SGI.154]|uniref:cell division protein FtsQ/DivIB n=1 Tax=Bariatricus sp. SGI.154 TaxID=3420549 RepID=UPI003D08A413